MNKEEIKKKDLECDPCGAELLVAIHCFRLTKVKGIVGWRGCHENFQTEAAFQLHRYHGGCRSGWSCKLRWNGVSWEEREPDDLGRVLGAKVRK